MQQPKSNVSFDGPFKYAKLNTDFGRYEGQVVNNIPHGRGTLLFKNGNLINWKYKGDFSKGQMVGEGTLVDEKNTVRYTGEYLNSKKSGFGKEYGKHGLIKYEGGWSNGYREGSCIKYKDNGMEKLYEGQIKKDKREG